MGASVGEIESNLTLPFLFPMCLLGGKEVRLIHRAFTAPFPLPKVSCVSRPGVAGAVVQTAIYLARSLTHKAILFLINH